jgi:hypothetical protein
MTEKIFSLIATFMVNPANPLPCNVVPAGSGGYAGFINATADGLRDRGRPVFTPG